MVTSVDRDLQLINNGVAQKLQVCPLNAHYSSGLRYSLFRCNGPAGRRPRRHCVSFEGNQL
jgi:hypothetical protein